MGARPPPRDFVRVNTIKVKKKMIRQWSTRYSLQSCEENTLYPLTPNSVTGFPFQDISHYKVIQENTKPA